MSGCQAGWQKPDLIYLGLDEVITTAPEHLGVGPRSCHTWSVYSIQLSGAGPAWYLMD